MSAAKHTPGPWYVENEAIYGAPAGNGDVVISPITPEILDDIKAGDWDDCTSPLAADLVLAAAAPELLEALQFALRDMEATRAQYASHATCVGVLGQSIAAARAAIAKATWSAS